MVRKPKLADLALVLAVLAVLAFAAPLGPAAMAAAPYNPAQSQTSQSQDAKDQKAQPPKATQDNVPDAPSSVHPNPFPAGKPAPNNSPYGTPEAPAPQPSTPSPQPPEDAAQPQPNQPSSQINNGAPRKKDPNTDDSGREAFQVVVDVNLVTVPVTVKDGDQHLVAGLLRRDFTIYEDGVEQNIKFFTSDPFPLSAAVVLDENISDTTMRKINQTLPSIGGAFSQFDEVALYTYGSSVHKVNDYGPAIGLTAELRRVKKTGRTGGVPVTSGPLASGPSVNGHPIDPGTPHVVTPDKPSTTLNDALLRAAMDLSRREKARRRIIFLISDGKEQGSEASYTEVLKVLLSHEIAVYALGVDSAAIPIYDRLSRIHLPDLGYGNILPKYVFATGGDYFAELTKDAIEKTYAHMTEVARNQYTIGYSTRMTPASNYRTIEVRVHRPGLKVSARDGYYPLPRTRSASPSGGNRSDNPQ